MCGWKVAQDVEMVKYCGVVLTLGIPLAFIPKCFCNCFFFCLFVFFLRFFKFIFFKSVYGRVEKEICTVVLL